MNQNYIFFKEYKDMFNNYNNIKQINKNYKLFFNQKDKKYYVVNTNNNFEICLINKTIFDNFVDKLRFCKIENLNKILKKIDSENETNEIKNTNKYREIVNYSLKETLSLTNRSSFINNNDITKIIGATKC